MSDPNGAGGQGASPFPTLRELRASHSELLKRLRDSGDVREFAPEVEAFIRRGRASGARLDVEHDRWDAQRSLDYWSTMLYRAGVEPPDATLEEFDASQAPKLRDDLRPYIGLAAFQKEDAENFFGRRELVEKMTGRLAAEKFLAVIGPSGSGKSSLVRAGILPALESGALLGSEHWHYFPRPMVPGSEPLANLARVLNPAPTPPASAWTTDQVQGFLRRPDHLLDILDGFGGRPCVLVIDQFEELFTLCDDEGMRRAFTDNLLHVIRSADARHSIIVTMRIDFEPFVARLPEFYAHFEKAEERIPPFTAVELREAIEGPARRVGLVFEDGVVESLLQDILGEPAALPLLQFTLFKLWENRLYNRVTLDAYTMLGGGRLALARSADALYESMTQEDRNTVQPILLRMVRPGTGLEVTSSRVTLASLYPEGEGSDRVERVLQKLIDARLVRKTEGETPEDTQVEVAHEALVRNWPRLVEWLEEERAAMMTRRRLEAKALEWVRLGSGQSGLLDAKQLYEALNWMESPEALRLGYDKALPALVEASRAALEEAERERTEARLRELEQARALEEAERRRGEEEKQAEEERRTAARLRRSARTLAALLIVGVLLILLASWLGVLAWRQAGIAASAQGEAIKARDRAEWLAGIAAENEKRAQNNEAEAKLAALNAQEAQELAEAEKRKAIEALKKLQEEHKGRVKEKQGRIKAETELAKALGLKAPNNTTDPTNSNNAGAGTPPHIAEKWLHEVARPVRPGVSVSSAAKRNYVAASSVCCSVVDASGKKYLLVADEGDFKVGEPLMQPGALDGGKPENAVATITRAGGGFAFGMLALLKEGVEATNEIPGLGRINGVATAEVDQTVTHVGRTTGIVRGRVTSIATDIAVQSEDGIVRLYDMIIIQGLDGGPFSSGGDGGGPVLTQDGKLVGVIVAGSSTHTIVMPIRRFWQGLQVELAP
jgi:energy-coupling factor transporter ATP-binding protein EcfA2